MASDSDDDDDDDDDDFPGFMKFHPSMCHFFWKTHVTMRPCDI